MTCAAWQRDRREEQRRRRGRTCVPERGVGNFGSREGDRSWTTVRVSQITSAVLLMTCILWLDIYGNMRWEPCKHTQPICLGEPMPACVCLWLRKKESVSKWSRKIANCVGKWPLRYAVVLSISQLYEFADTLFECVGPCLNWRIKIIHRCGACASEASSRLGKFPDFYMF